MNQKTTYIMLAAVVAAALGIWALRPDAPKNDKTETQTRELFDPAPDNLTAIEVSPQDRPPLMFSKVDGRWQITAPITAQAVAGMVDRIGTQLREMVVRLSFKSNDPDRPGDDLTGLSRPIRLKVTDAAGKAWLLKVGREVPAKREMYVQRDADETIYVVSSELRVDLERGLADFRDKRITTLEVNEARRIEIAGGESYVLARGGDDAWTVESPVRGRADKTAVENILRTIGGMMVANFVDAPPGALGAYGLEKPALKVVVHCEKRTPKPATQPAATQPAPPQFDVMPYTVAFSLGAKTGDKRFGKLDDGSAAPTIFQIMDSQVAAFAPSLTSLRDKAIARFAANRVQKVSIRSASGSAELERQPAGWRFASGAPTKGEAAEAAAVEDLLRALRELSAIGFEPDDPLREDGLAHPRVEITLTEEGTPAPIRLQVGSMTPSESGIYVRNEGEMFIAVAKAEAVEPLEVTPLSFAPRNMLQFDRSQVTRIDATQEGRNISLTLDTGRWRAAAPLNSDADASAVINLMADLSNLRARTMAGPASELARFGLEPPLATCRITLQPPPPASQATSAPAEPPRTVVVRAGRANGNSYVFVEGGELIGEVDARVVENLTAELLDKKVVEVQASAIQSLRISRGTTVIKFERRGGEWTLAGESSFPVDAAKLTPLTERFATLKAQRYIRYEAGPLASFGLDPAAVTVIAELEGGTTQELRISASGPADDALMRRFATTGSGGRVFLLSKDDATAFDADLKSFRRP